MKKYDSNQVINDIRKGKYYIEWKINYEYNPCWMTVEGISTCKRFVFTYNAFSGGKIIIDNKKTCPKDNDKEDMYYNFIEFKKYSEKWYENRLIEKELQRRKKHGD